MLEAYPSENYTKDRNCKNSFLLSDFTEKDASFFLAMSHFLVIHKHGLMPIFSKSIQAFIVSFVFPSMSSIVPTSVSNTFFSTCITSRLCLNFNFDQYRSSNNLILCVQFRCVFGLVLFTNLSNGAKSKTFT